MESGGAARAPGAGGMWKPPPMLNGSLGGAGGPAPIRGGGGGGGAHGVGAGPMPGSGGGGGGGAPPVVPIAPSLPDPPLAVDMNMLLHQIPNQVKWKSFTIHKKICFVFFSFFLSGQRQTKSAEL